jgi:hypothetical protein
MAWPTSKPTTSAFDNAEDSIATSRAELNTMSAAVNDIVDFIDTSAIADGRILQYDATSGALKFVVNTAGGETHIQAGAGITVTKADSAGQHEVAFSGSYTTGFTVYTFANTSQLGIASTGSVPTIQSTHANYPGINLRTHSTYDGHISLVGGENGNIKIEPHGTGKVRLHDAYNLPTADGSNGQVIQTDGAGNLSFATVSGGGSVSPLTADLETGGYNIVGNNGQLSLFVDQNDSGGAQIQFGGPTGYAWIDEDGNEFHGSGSLSINPGNATTANSTIYMAETGNKMYIRGTGACEINRIEFPEAISQSASVGQVLRVASVGNAGVFNNNDVVNLEFATVAGGQDNQITTGGSDNITITQPDSGGAFNIALANPLNNPVDANNQAISNAILKGYSETINTGLGTSGTLTPDVADGNVQTVTLSGNITVNALASVANGDSLTLIIRQPASGGPHTLSSTMKFAGGTKTLSTAANAIDVLTIFYDGTDYLASLGTNFS